MNNYKLQIEFVNGSVAVIDLGKRVRAMRFCRLSDPELFASAKANGDLITWSAKGETFSVFIDELLDSMLMA